LWILSWGARGERTCYISEDTDDHNDDNVNNHDCANDPKDDNADDNDDSGDENSYTYKDSDSDN
jgi:hypothetical protein